MPTLIYTGIHPQVVCLATGSDDLVNWEKYPGNPVIAEPPPELGAQTEGQFRDPFVWREDGTWRMVMGSKVEGRGGLVLRYHSADLLRWEYDGVLLQGDITRTQPFWTGTVWECPNFFRLGGQPILIVSVQAEPRDLLYSVCYAGGFHDQQFTPAVERILVHGSSFYAPQVMLLADGRTVLFGWLKEGRRPTAVLEAGWAGVMSLPMTLAWMPDTPPKACTPTPKGVGAGGAGGALRLAPVEELKALRREHHHLEEVGIAPGAADLLDDIQGDCLEIEAIFEPEGEAEFGLRLRCSPDGAEQTRVVYQGAQRRLVIEPNESSLSTVVDRDLHKALVPLDASGQLRLHLFLDRSVLEVFANDDTCLASRIYPTRPDSLGLGLFSREGAVKLKSLDVYTMASIWE